jgi:NAD(P)-dependent dehydrogenase (short-subunit alcohol dehydrogenase family)
MKRLDGRVAAITGSARGIGRGIAERFLAEGARVALLDVNEDGVNATASELGEGAIGIQCDVTSADSVENAIETVNTEWDNVDVLVNSAGWSKISPIEHTSEEVWDRTLDINLKGMFLLSRAVVPAMKEQKWGRIINLSSQSGKKGNSSYTAYCASKFGVIGFTQALAQELAEDGITANSICPGIVFTEMWGPEQVNAYAAKRSMPPEDVKDYLVDKIPMKRAATLDDISGLASYLASDEASYFSGQSYNVTGGTVMH